MTRPARSVPTGSSAAAGFPLPVDVYALALLSRKGEQGAGRSWRLRVRRGSVHELDDAIDRWLGPCDDADRTVLDRCAGGALDVGCGPGRLVAALNLSGVVALGIDTNEVAVALTRGRGGRALRADVFATLPDEGRWRSVLLLDGNIGIGGDPGRLLRRCAALLAPGGELLVELSPPGRSGDVVQLRLESDDEVGPWFPWAGLSVDDVATCAAGASLHVQEIWSRGLRWFAALTG